MRDEFLSRVQQLQRRMALQDISGLYIPLGPNFTYLSGMSLAPTSHAAARVFALILPRLKNPTLVVPARRRRFVERNTWIDDITAWTFPESPWPAVVAAFRELGITQGRVGIDSRTAWQDCREIRNELPELEFVDVSSTLAEIRLNKTVWELAQMKKAGQLADRAVARGLAAVRSGITEADVAAEIFRYLLGEGAEVALVSVISGQHRGFPERSESKIIAPGESIMLFPKFQLGGYYVDITRMALVGPVSSEQERIEQALLESHGEALAVAGPGVPFRTVDEIARQSLGKYGLEKYLTHGIGHGVGLETHESPYVDDEMVLVPGMIFTIEPSVYFPGGPAYRIEDTFAVTMNGTLPLTNLERGFWRVP